MRIDLKAKVRTSDGHDAGTVRKVVIDPKTEKITGLVISTGKLFGREVIVSEEALADAEPSGDTITLSLTKEELAAQPTFEEADYVLPPAGWTASLGYTYPPSVYLWPTEVDEIESRDEGRSRPAIKKGAAVRDRDGDMVGVVEDVRLDEGTGQVLSFIVKAGAGVERLFGGGRIAEIPRENIRQILDDEVRLAVDREEIVPKEHETGSR